MIWCHVSWCTLLPYHFYNKNSQKFELFFCKNAVQQCFLWNRQIKSRTEFDDAQKLQSMLLSCNDVIWIVMLNGSHCLLQCFKATTVKKLNHCCLQNITMTTFFIKKTRTKTWSFRTKAKNTLWNDNNHKIAIWGWQCGEQSPLTFFFLQCQQFLHLTKLFWKSDLIFWNI